MILMPESGRTAKQILGLISLALVPFGVVSYIYSNQVLTDIERLPTSAEEALLAPVSDLGLLRVGGGLAALVGMVFLLVYVVDYVKNPDVYAEDYSRRAAILGVVGGLVWIIGAVVFGYLPAVSDVGDIVTRSVGSFGDPASYAREYERAVFRMAISSGALVLGFVWWLISLVSWMESPDTTASVMMLSDEPYCSSCGAKLSDEEATECYNCGSKLN